jgi:hypothetical protein
VSAFRHRLPRLAAIVLLLWLFASGVAFAHACQARIDLDCPDCCAEMKAPSAWNATRTDATVPAQAAIALPAAPAAVQVAWVPPPVRAFPATDPPARGAQRIPVFFLRLAL